jgi:hypothetical protein
MKKTNFILLVISFILFSSCNMPRKSEADDISVFLNQTQTSIAIEQLLKYSATSPVESTPVIQNTVTNEAPSPTQPISSPTQPVLTQTTPSDTDCTNLAKFINETYPDNSKFPPNQAFIKSWVFQNSGTCTWTPEYEIVFQEGDQLGGTSPSPIGQTVSPGNTIEINLPQTAPEVAGQYQGYWKLRSTEGLIFGLGDDGSVPFWVKIIVEGQVETITPQNFTFDSPTWSQSFNQGTSIFPLGSDSTTKFEVKNNRLKITAFSPSGDQWRVANGYIDNFALEIIFNTINPCKGKDSYGMIVRAPDQPDGIIDTGYIFTISCDGNYRIYRMDNGNYNSIVDWTPHQNIKKGEGQTNAMGVLARGDLFQLYINGMLIYEFLDNAYPSGLYGPTIRTTIEQDFSVNLQQISYWKLDN